MYAAISSSFEENSRYKVVGATFVRKSEGELMILVTGATGNVGGELVRALAAAGQQVRP